MWDGNPIEPLVYTERVPLSDGRWMTVMIPKEFALVKKPELLKVGLPSRHTEGEGEADSVPVQEPERP